jgi:superfamily II DNA or RNA helicase
VPSSRDSSGRKAGLWPVATYAYTLRDYQLQGVADIRAAMGRHRRICYVLPTGGGKTVIFAYLAWATAAKGTRVLVLSHRQEIADQISEALDIMGVAHGAIRPGMAMTDHHVQVAMVQTLVRRLDRITPPDLIVIDECHHAVASSWKKVLERFGRAYVLGVTATPERLDGQGLREVGFQELVLGPDVAELITRGFLARYRYLGAKLAVDFSSVRHIGGDYDQGEVARKLTSKAITGDIIAHYRKHLDGRTCIVFCPTVAYAKAIAEAYCEAGIAADSIDGTMNPDDRRAVVSALRTGSIKVLTSCEVISEGFDAPAVGGCQLLRPTESFALFRQQIGRSLRPKADGSPAVVLDHVQNYQLHGLPDDDHEWSLDSVAKKPERKPVRQCKACGEMFPPRRQQPPCPGVPDCIFARPSTPRVITLRGGELEELTPGARDPAVTWANGIDLKTGRYFRLLALAKGRYERLLQMANARGYKKGWAWHKAQEWRDEHGKEA